MNELTFIGGGNMATAIISGLIANGMDAGGIEVVEPSEDAAARLKQRFGIKVQPGLDKAVLHPIIVLAVKPQLLPEVAKQLAPRLKNHLVISIAAGVRVADLSRWLGGHERIVRTMPNTPAMVGAGITGLFAGKASGEGDRSRAEAVLRAVGSVVWLDGESDLDWVTAVSGSGPAYVFYFIEALEAAAKSAGLPAETARHLALHTVFGAAKLALEAGEEPSVLRARVTSKGGTTERGIASLESDGLAELVARAVKAAAERSRELGDELGGLG
jgi:pyrroline-5-carboxylate reductase